MTASADRGHRQTAALDHVAQQPARRYFASNERMAFRYDWRISLRTNIRHSAGMTVSVTTIEAMIAKP